MRRSPRRRNFASFVNIAHLHVRFARLASERDGRLGATVTLTRRKPAQLIFDVLRHRQPDTCRTVAAKGGTAHVLFELNGRGRTSCRKRSVPNNDSPLRPPKIDVKRFRLSPTGDTPNPTRRIL